MKQMIILAPPIDGIFLNHHLDIPIDHFLYHILDQNQEVTLLNWLNPCTAETNIHKFFSVSRIIPLFCFDIIILTYLF